MKLKLEFAEDVRELAEKLNAVMDLGLDLSKVAFIRTRNSRSRAYARTFALPSQWRFVLNPKVIYVVEVISEKFDKLDCEDKLTVVLHELLHIPKSMSGGLRNHSYRGFREIRKYREKLRALCLGTGKTG